MLSAYAFILPEPLGQSMRNELTLHELRCFLHLAQVGDPPVPIVEFVYDRSCPNAEAARAHLLEAFARAKLTPSWSEYLIGDPGIPRHACGYGSPTILVDGRDVSGAASGSDTCCRLYEMEDGRLLPVPSVSQIVAELARATRALPTP